MTLLKEWTPPEEFDEYRVVQPLGEGGMGWVFLAHDTLLDRMVAVKFISSMEPNSESRERFLIEARAAARLQHPNVAAVYRVGELDSRPYIISEFIRGRTLDTLVLPLPWRRALELGIFLARGLAAAHRHGVLHRDIKPSNAILTDDGEVKLVDFGLAKLTDDYVPNSTIPPPPSRPSRPRIPRDAPTMLSNVESLEVAAYPPLPAVMESTKPPPLIAADTTRVSHGTEAISDTAPAKTTSKRGSQSDAPPSGTLTKIGDVMGTPFYMAPEVWRGEVATRRADVYALGIVLYELCSGSPPHRDVGLKSLKRVRCEQDVPPLAVTSPAVDARFAAVVDRCLERDPAKRFGSGDELLDALEQVIPLASGVAIPEGNPYRGLSSFEAEHRALFFGRTTEMRAVIERLRSEPFVLVASDSGLGKSSLCRAGVLPLVEEGALQEGRTWSVVRLVPGRRPLAAIAAAISPILDGRDEEELAVALGAEPEQVFRILRKQLGAKRGLVIFVDQLEELLTLSVAEEASATAALFGRLAVGVPGVRLLATVRGDFLTRLTRLPGFPTDLPRALYVLRPMLPDRIREAIVGPAHATGVRFESDALVDTLVESTASTDGALPLLQFALAELWDARNTIKKVIPSSALDAVGGVAGALARHADAVLRSLLPSERAAARRVLMRLVTLEGTRARRTEDELIAGDPAAKTALDALVRGRLLAAREVEGGTAYEVAHEALLHGWTTLRDWLDAQAENRVVRHRLESAATEWGRLGRTRDALWSERQLAEALSLESSELHPQEAEFLKSSRQAVRRARRLRYVALASIPALLALTYVTMNIQTRRDIDRKIAVHFSEATAALTEARAQDVEMTTLRTEAFRQFDSQDRKAAEDAWARALSMTRTTDRSYGRAAQALESALELDATRRELRDTLGDILFERALLAERDHRVEQMDELFQRLEVYDKSGERRAHRDAPATITITTTPVPAHLTLEKYVDEAGRLRPVKMRDFEANPSATLELPPGSYVLTCVAPQRYEVRYPIYLHRGETLAVPIELPEAASIPRGFVYIPEGRFNFGTSAVEQIRGFLDTAAIHEIRTDAYIISRTETTYADWIEYLSAMPPKERAEHNQKFAHYRGSVELAELPDGKWKLTFQPAGQLYAVESGSMITYRSRRMRATQDWLRFPISGISAQDVDSYARWLHNSGRVPGARMCLEKEWERAARGADEREFPHGNRIEPEDANFDMTYGREPGGFGPDEAGSYPQSRSPFGLDDMAGNVWEWTRSTLSADSYVLRGGSFYQYNNVNRSTNREGTEPTVRDVTIGTRICANYPPR